MRKLRWTGVTAAEIAQRVWDLGVSTDALAIRLGSLGVRVSAEVSALLSQPTQRLLRHSWMGQNAAFEDEITQRMDNAASRRFPVSLQHAHLDKIASGDLGKGTLAWMLGVGADQLEVEAPPEAAEIDSDALAAALEL
jgi:hypothetical protein